MRSVTMDGGTVVYRPNLVDQIALTATILVGARRNGMTFVQIRLSRLVVDFVQVYVPDYRVKCKTALSVTTRATNGNAGLNSG
jgi:hypothetical protein